MERDDLVSYIEKLQGVADSTENKKKQKKLYKEISDYRRALELDTNKVLLEDEKRAQEELAKIRRESYQNILKSETASHKEKLEATNALIKDNFENSIRSVTSGLSNTIDELQDKLNGIMEHYISMQESINTHLMGTGNTFSNITSNLNRVIGISGIVKQEDVYSNLQALVREGITTNVEQRAFLQTLANDIDASFQANSQTLNRLIRLQGEDSSANRLALEISLQQFLNQNYATSQYIKDGFTGVADALLEAESLMNSSTALSYEAMVQSWLGSYYSYGVSGSSINSLAQGINELSSGNLANIGSGISNLLFMGLSRSGQEVGSVLHNGLTQSGVNDLMAGVTTYLQEMGNTNSHVVESEIARIFGLTISDMEALRNFNPGSSGQISSDIGVLNSLSENITWSTKLNNMLSNFMYNWGTDIAATGARYMTWQVSNMVAGILGDALDGVNIGGEVGLPFLKGTFDMNLGEMVEALPMGISFITELAGSLGSLGNTGLFNGSAITNILNGLANRGGSVNGRNISISGPGTSASMSISLADSAESAINSLNENLGGANIGSDEESPAERTATEAEKQTGILNDILAKMSDLSLTAMGEAAVSSYGDLTW